MCLPSPSTLLRSQPRLPGRKATLADGDALRLGDVMLTQLEPGSFLKRVRATAAAL